MYLAWLLLEPASSLHNNYKSNTAYSQQVIVCFAQPAIGKYLLVFDRLEVNVGCSFNEIENSDIRNTCVVDKTPCNAL